jgi:hypothetical protein
MAPTQRSDGPGGRIEDGLPDGIEPDEARRGRRGESERRRGERHESRLRDLARRLLAERERAPRDVEEDADRDGYVPLEAARDVVASLLETGDRAKNEMVRMVAREVRNYLSELKLGEELHRMLRDYELEVHATFKLRPHGVAPAPGQPESEPAAPATPDPQT